MQLTVTIESTFSGRAAGYEVQEVSDTDLVKSLIENYCAYKEIKYEQSFVVKGNDYVALDSNKTLAEAGVQDGDHLFLASGIDEERTFAFNNWWILAALASAIGLIGLIAVNILFAANYIPFDYGIVFDAGSTHTQMLVYSWEADKWLGTGVVKQVDSCDMDGGIANLERKQNNVTNYLGGCLKKGVSEVPEKVKSNSPLFLAATAGMRLLELQHERDVVKILNEVRGLFNKTALNFSDSNVKIITGQEEGLSGWISSNYLLGSLKKMPSVPAGNNRSTFGALDLGGASTQISFEVSDEDMNATDVHMLQLYGTKYHVYTRSYLCYGVKEIQRRYYILLLVDNQISEKGKQPIESPCDPIGYSSNRTLDMLFPSPCTIPSRAYNFSTQVKSVTFAGSSNATQCRAFVRQLFNSSYCSSVFTEGDCFENKAIPSKKSPDFLAFSTFSYLATGLNVTGKESRDDYLQKVMRICNLNWKQLNGTVFPGFSPKFRRNICFQGMYHYILLAEGYNFSDDMWKSVKYAGTINNEEVGWALGFMINATNVIPEEEPIERISVTVFVLLVVLFVAFFAISLLFAIHAVRLRRQSTSYQRLSYGTMEA